MSASQDARMDHLLELLQEHGRSLRSLEGTLERLLPLLARAPTGSGQNNRATIVQTDRTPMWVCVIVVVALAAAMWGRDDSAREEITRLQADVRELRAVDQDLRSTDNAVRAYINTGILKPKVEANKGSQ